MITFETRVAGIPCQCQVITDDTEKRDNFEFYILDRKGYYALWLERKLNPVMVDELFEEFQEHVA